MREGRARADYDTRLLAADAGGIREAAALLRAGQVVGMPTETVYGLAANALDPAAVRRIFAAKGRPADNPLIVHIASLDMLAGVAGEPSADARRLADAFWPGPLTMVLPKSDAVPREVSAGLDTVGVRMPSHPAARALIAAAGLPLAAPSANLSGRPSPTRAQHVLDDMAGRIPLVLDGGACEVGLESTVVSLAGGAHPLVLRPGRVSAADMAAVLGKRVDTADAVLAPLAPGEAAASPGLKYRHYAPRAQLTIVEGSRRAFAGYVAAHAEPGVFALCFHGEEKLLNVPAVCYGRAGDEVSQAAELFAALRALDDRGARVVYARCPDAAGGVGLAAYNRLLRAASFRVVSAAGG